ncbi:hypothetical protein [Neisseria sp.]|uniref:hypothetical protein n=1 Tax=Neisseria sp. TaxID=192066 RepID=UPI00359FD0F8
MTDYFNRHRKYLPVFRLWEGIFWIFFGSRPSENKPSENYFAADADDGTEGAASADAAASADDAGAAVLASSDGLWFFLRLTLTPTISLKLRPSFPYRRESGRIKWEWNFNAEAAFFSSYRKSITPDSRLRGNGGLFQPTREMFAGLSALGGIFWRFFGNRPSENQAV